MKRLTVLFAALAAAVAFADAKEDAQKKVDEAMAQSCQMAKDNIAKQAEACADENTKMQAVDCKDKASRKTQDFLKLNVECANKVKAGAKGKAEEMKKEAAARGDEKKAEEGKPAGEEKKKKETSCKAVDGTGATLAEATVEGTIVKCSGELNKKVRETCTEADAGQKKQYEVIGTFLGKETKSKGTVTCPKAKKK